MRVGAAVYYTLSDHIGSTSITLNNSGTKIAEMRYKAWGEVRYEDGTLQTDRTYTGQRSYTDDFGLMFYNARWYDSQIGRFAQADTITPIGIQGLDRYAYVNNSPVNYTDSTGHQTDCSQIPDGTSRSACESGNQQEQAYWQSQTNVFILICGDDMVDQCLPGGGNGSTYAAPYGGHVPGYPGGTQPLQPARDWAALNGITTFNYATGSCGCTSLTNQIAQKMMQIAGMNPNIKFTLVGFSGGGSSVIEAAYQASLALGGTVSTSNIHTISIDGLASTSSVQDHADELARKGAYTSFFNSQHYLNSQNYYKLSSGTIGQKFPLLHSLDGSSTNIPSAVYFPQWGPPNPTGHTMLAVDYNIFTQYFYPVLP